MTTENSTTEATQTDLVTKAAVAAGVIPAPEKTSKKPASKKAAKKAAAKKEAKPAAKKAAKKQAKPTSKKAAKTDAAVPREFSKKAIVIDLMRRKEGATLAEIAKATEWQRHSIRGFISGSLTKKMGLKVESTKNANGERCYRIK